MDRPKTPLFDEVMAELDRDTNHTLIPAHKMLIKEAIICFASDCQIDSAFREELDALTTFDETGKCMAYQKEG